MAAQQMNYKSIKNQYLQQQVKTAGPEKLILMLYDIGLKSCKTKDRSKASKAVVELISSLNFDYKEIALGYFTLYRFALDGINTGKFEDAILVLEGLREVWKSAVMGQPSGSLN